MDRAPHVGIEAAEFLLHREIGARVGDRALDLEAIAHDARIGEKAALPSGREARHRYRIEPGERGAVRRALPQDGLPAQAGLCALEDEEFEELEIVVHGPAPLGVMI